MSENPIRSRVFWLLTACSWLFVRFCLWMRDAECSLLVINKATHRAFNPSTCCAVCHIVLRSGFLQLSRMWLLSSMWETDVAWLWCKRRKQQSKRWVRFATWMLISTWLWRQYLNNSPATLTRLDIDVGPWDVEYIHDAMSNKLRDPSFLPYLKSLGHYFCDFTMVNSLSTVMSESGVCIYNNISF